MSFILAFSISGCFSHWVNQVLYPSRVLVKQRFPSIHSLESPVKRTLSRERRIVGFGGVGGRKVGWVGPTLLSQALFFFPESACEVVVEANAFHDPLVFMTGGFGGSSPESVVSRRSETGRFNAPVEIGA